jgi:hypothetical protein
MTAHACVPHAITVDMLRGGGRSSVRETCSCGRTSTWIQTNAGAIVILDTSGRRK